MVQYRRTPPASVRAQLKGPLVSIENRRQLENTWLQLQELEQLYEKKRHEPAADTPLLELTLRSLKKRINQFKEGITRYETRVRSAEQDG